MKRWWPIPSVFTHKGKFFEAVAGDAANEIEAVPAMTKFTLVPGEYTFTIPRTAFVKSTNEGAWDGVTIDVSWYSETASEPHISTPAPSVDENGKDKLTWNAIDGAAEYILYLCDADGNVQKAATTKTSMNHNSTEAGVSYTYKVQAECDVDAATSAYSAAFYGKIYNQDRIKVKRCQSNRIL